MKEFEQNQGISYMGLARCFRYVVWVLGHRNGRHVDTCKIELLEGMSELVYDVRVER